MLTLLFTVSGPQDRTQSPSVADMLKTASASSSSSLYKASRPSSFKRKRSSSDDLQDMPDPVQNRAGAPYSFSHTGSKYDEDDYEDELSC